MPVRTSSTVNGGYQMKDGHRKRFNAYHLLRAVLEVFRENDDAEKAGECSRKAASENWTLVGEARKEVWKRVRDKWSRYTGCDPDDYPWSRTGVARLYMDVRKDGRVKADEEYNRLIDGYYR